jgi:hypothetical protein
MIEPFAVGIGAVGGALSRWQLTTLSSKFGLTPWSTAGYSYTNIDIGQYPMILNIKNHHCTYPLFMLFDF